MLKWSINRNFLKFNELEYFVSMFLGQIRTLAVESQAQGRKHTKLKIVDNVGVIVLDSPGVKVRII